VPNMSYSINLEFIDLWRGTIESGYCFIKCYIKQFEIILAIDSKFLKWKNFVFENFGF